MKTWSHYAFVTHDTPFAWNTVPNQGLLIIDMDSVNESNPRLKAVNFPILDSLGNYDTLKTVHNLFIDEKGYCYLFGANIGNGGALIFDIKSDPWSNLCGKLGYLLSARRNGKRRYALGICYQ